MRGATSAARLKRKAAGLEPIPEPHKTAAARKANRARNGRRNVDTRPGVRIAGQSVAETQEFFRIVKQNQTETRMQALHIAVTASPAVVHRLVDLAMGRREFVKAPAAVQRAAMVDVLTIARVAGQDAAESSRKADEPLNETELGTLRALVGALESIRNQQSVIEAEDVEPVDNSALGEKSPGVPVDNSETAFNSTGCEGRQPDSHTVRHDASRPDAGEPDAPDAGEHDAPRA